MPCTGKRDSQSFRLVCSSNASLCDAAPAAQGCTRKVKHSGESMTRRDDGWASKKRQQESRGVQVDGGRVARVDRLCGGWFTGIENVLAQSCHKHRVKVLTHETVGSPSVHVKMHPNSILLFCSCKKPLGCTCVLSPCLLKCCFLSTPPNACAVHSLSLHQSFNTLLPLNTFSSCFGSST